MGSVSEAVPAAAELLCSGMPSLLSRSRLFSALDSYGTGQEWGSISMEKLSERLKGIMQEHQTVRVCMQLNLSRGDRTLHGQD